MIEILNKKNFYSMILKDRHPLAKIDFPTECGKGRVNFYRTPLGTAIRVNLEGEDKMLELKMYDRNRSNFVIQNIFCGENLIEISRGVFVGVSSKLHIEDAIGREFLIKLNNMSIIARAETTLNLGRNVDKTPSLVYN